MTDRNGADSNVVDRWVAPRLEKYAIWATMVFLLYFFNSHESVKNRVEVTEKQILVLSQEKISRMELKAFEDRVTTQLAAISANNKSDLNDMKASLVDRLDLMIKAIKQRE